MCLVALFFRAIRGAPVIIGANREEAYARPGTPPQLIEGPIRAVAGRDPVAGGTWLGVNERGVVVAVTNRPKTDLPPQARSRGLLVRDLLGLPRAAAAVQLAGQQLGSGAYAGCNLLCADASAAYVIHAGDWLRVLPLPPGLYVLTARDVNDPTDARIGHARTWLSGRPYGEVDDCVRALQELCAQAGSDGPAMCLHGKTGGTVSSSVIAVRPPPTHGIYLHAQGPPDETPFEGYSALVRDFAFGLDG